MAQAKSTVKKAAKKSTSAKTAAPAKKTATKTSAEKAAPKKAGPKAAAKAKSDASEVTYKLRVGDPAPAFHAQATSGRVLSSNDFKNKWLVLYFYPKDSTPGCTLEGQGFKRLQKEFGKLGCEIVGVSRDSVKSHESFKEKCAFPFELLSDSDGLVCKAFDVIQMKQLYGRVYEGIERSTFLIGKNGKVAAEWRKVKVNGHAEEVFAALKAQA